MARRATGAARRPLVFDTDVLIWYFRGNVRARNVLHRTPQERRWLSAISFMELLQGARQTSELADIQAFIAENFSRILHPRTAVSEKAIHCIVQWGLSDGLRVADAIIAASAILARATLVTGNVRHFRFIPELQFQAFTP